MHPLLYTTISIIGTNNMLRNTAIAIFLLKTVDDRFIM